MTIPDELIIYTRAETETDAVAEERARQLNWQFDGEPITPSRPHQKVPTPEDAEPPSENRAYPADLPLDTVICGDNLEHLSRLPDGCVNLVITSPPYFNQREYGASGVGNEETLAEYLDNVLRVFGECVRVAAPDGSIVFNLGDKYEDASLLLVPYRFAVAATAAFPVKLVNNITWVKQNPTPRQF